MSALPDPELPLSVDDSFLEEESLEDESLLESLPWLSALFFPEPLPPEAARESVL